VRGKPVTTALSVTTAIASASSESQLFPITDGVARRGRDGTGGPRWLRRGRTMGVAVGKRRRYTVYRGMGFVNLEQLDFWERSRS